MKLIDLKTDKDVFDYITNNLLQQNERCIQAETNETCGYRGYRKADLNKKSREIFNMDFDSLDEYDEMLICTEELDFNLKCAVGFVIEDSFYDGNIEGNTVEDEIVKEIVIKSLPNWVRNNNSFGMLRMLQSTHDFNDPIHWEHEFKRFRFTKDGEYEHLES